MSWLWRWVLIQRKKIIFVFSKWGGKLEKEKKD